MSVLVQIREAAAKVINELYQQEIRPESLVFNETKPEFEGDYTLVLFGLIKQLRQNPELLGQAIGTHLLQQHPQLVGGFNVVKGFLNLSVATDYWQQLLGQPVPQLPKDRSKVMVEFSSPNTNKPLHLGHLRNNFLGVAVANLLEAAGHEVVRTCVVNDRGVHICKSMVAWQKFFNGATPESSGQKGDHFVGDCYVRFEQVLKTEAAAEMTLLENGDFSHLATANAEKARVLAGKLSTETDGEKLKEAKAALYELARNATPLMKEVRDMLLDWENGKPDVIALWEKMNGWVYDGFASTYKEIGTSFDKTYYESNLYLLGKDLVKEGLSKGIFFQKKDGSVWIDLTKDGLDEKLVQRADGTSVYITQDIGLAQLKQQEFGAQQSLYVVGDEQNYHFKVLKLIAEKLALPNAEGIEHVSYGMVELPHGRMKSREGTVVDADDLVAEMRSTAAAKTAELGKTEGFTEEQLQTLYNTLGLGALKFFLLRVDPKKRIIFNPEESIEFQGFTGPFIQYSFARLQSIQRKAAGGASESGTYSLNADEHLLLRQLDQYDITLTDAAESFDPSRLAQYLYGLAQQCNTFLAHHNVLHTTEPGARESRLKLCEQVAATLQAGMRLLGIEVPERM